jgi:voltage-gated potassium channel
MNRYNENDKKSIRWSLFNIIRDDDKNNTISTIFDCIILSLIFLNIVIIIFDTFRNVPGEILKIFSSIEAVTTIIFTLEYIARVWTAIYIYPQKRYIVAQIRYVFTFKAIIDLLSIFPFYLPFLFPVKNLLFLRIIRLLRILRLFKLNRYTNALSKVGNILKNKSYQLICSFSVVMILMLLSSVLMYYIESDDQPDVFENAFSGLWWAIATVTTVGYGDIYPVSGLGKILGAFIAILGIGLIAVPTSIITAGFIEQIPNKKEKKNYCPYCGRKLEKEE